MTHHDELTALRRYTRQQAADLLNIPDTWLKVWVTDREVPHQRSGTPGPRQRGVWFAYDDILEIGRMLSALMLGRQANSRAESPQVAEPTETTHPDGLQVTAAATPSGISEDQFAQFMRLESLRRP